MNGLLPTSASHPWAPSIDSTVPIAPAGAALVVSRGDRRMRGRTSLDSNPNVQGATAIPDVEAAPSEIGAELWPEQAAWRG
jgi:hypothetical protein